MSERIVVHPAAEISPLLQGEAFDAFLDVMRRFGQIDQLDPIVGVRVPEPDGKINGTIAILSGRTKLAACKKLGLKPNIEIYAGHESPAELAACLNILRPQLSTSQLAAAGVELEQQFAEEARERQKAAGGDRKSLLVKVPKAIGDGRLVDGRTFSATWAYLKDLPPARFERVYREHFPHHLGPVELKHRPALINEICNRLFPDLPTPGDVPKLVSGKTRAQMAAALTQTGPVKLERKRAFHAPLTSPDDSSFRKITAILDRMYGEDTKPDPVSIHSRRRASQICGVSETYIGRAKIVRDSNPGLFQKLRAGEVNLGTALQEVRRQVKRDTFDVPGLLPKIRPTSLDGGIRTGDSLKLLPLLPRRAFRLVITDPQYNIGIDYGDGSKSDQLTPGEYIAREERWIRQLPELLTPDGAVWVIISDEYAAEHVQMLKRAGLQMRGWIKWYETFGTNCSDRFNRTSRHLLYFVRNLKRVCFNRDVVLQQSARHRIYRDRRVAAGMAGAEGMKMWDDVWDIPRLSGTCAERLPDFPTQLPLALVQPIVEACSEPGDNVLDPFSGSGTTAAACILTGRNGVGIEINPVFAEKSRARLAKLSAGGSHERRQQ